MFLFPCFSGKNLKKKIETEVDSAHITCISCINTSTSVCDSDICHCKDNCETTIAGSQVSKTIEIIQPQQQTDESAGSLVDLDQ